MFEGLDKLNQIESKRILLIYLYKYCYQEFKNAKKRKKKKKRDLLYSVLFYGLCLSLYVHKKNLKRLISHFECFLKSIFNF